LGIGDWAQSPIPNPHFPLNNYFNLYIDLITIIIIILNIFFILIIFFPINIWVVLAGKFAHVSTI